MKIWDMQKRLKKGKYTLNLIPRNKFSMGKPIACIWKPHPTMNHKCRGVRTPNLSFLPLSSHQPSPTLFQKELQAAV